MTLFLFAVTPIITIILYIYFQDKYEKEPFGLLTKSFLLGAFVSVFIVLILYLITGRLIPVTDKFSVWQQFIQAFFVVALSEEFSKYIIVKYFAQPNKEFNEPYDGIVYAVMVSMGFACTENIMYVLKGGYETAILRAFTAVPAHATFGVLMGYFMGKAKFSNNRFGLNMTGLLLATLFHGAYDFFLFINFIPGIYIGAFISLIIGLILSRKAIKRHQKKSYFKHDK
ncbi:MAG: PrsW family intramembrane metalloprotease [Winogradskyella sp.]|uniref:PrsW family intramembrane metalloprotease n=1 Tax=Winogradskyella sp. TaxID=1883156 RepID=UPI001852526E|nr:PrsW family glutamic-type intramembrane protease [Winogradskyella sp.]MBT8244718.1 PrsW family intramembrane metalloprotease [Winogradskyella sp.]NNK22798.1 PrsW family intramembrane metalloprotease [Winogradskyella sp.]